MAAKNLQQTNTILTYVMMALIVVGAYFIGMYKTRADLLSGGTGAVPGSNGAEQVQQAPQSSLAEEDWVRVQDSPAAIMGDPDAQVVMVEYTDYFCPYCAEYVGVDAIPQLPTSEDNVFAQIKKKYIDTGKVRYMVRDQPAIHGDKAFKASEAARCAGDQGQYFAMHDLLFESYSTLSTGDVDTLLPEYATQLGLSTSEFNTCLTGGKYSDAVKADSELGTEVGATGTPTFFINGEFLVGAQPYAIFEQVIEEQLAK